MSISVVILLFPLIWYNKIKYTSNKSNEKYKTKNLQPC